MEVSEQASPQVKAQAQWRERLIEAVNRVVPNSGLTEVAARTAGRNGKPIAYTTLRSILMGSGQVDSTTLAAVCDAVGVDLSYVLTGSVGVRATQAVGNIKSGLGIGVIPVVKMADAARWKEIAANPDAYTEVIFCSEKDTKGLMAARVGDNSMSPDFAKGDIVTFRLGKPENTKQPAIVRVEGSNDAQLRYWRTSGDRIKLQAANEEYGATTVTEKRIDFVAHVVGHQRELD
jgi:SOS-response transcriptional repressor LexA